MGFIKAFKTIRSEGKKTKQKKKAIRGLKAETSLMRGAADTSKSMFSRRSTLAAGSQARLTTGAGKRKKATENYRK